MAALAQLIGPLYQPPQSCSKEASEGLFCFAFKGALAFAVPFAIERTQAVNSLIPLALHCVTPTHSKKLCRFLKIDSCLKVSDVDVGFAMF
jgi:hypothetical protein